MILKDKVFISTVSRDKSAGIRRVFEPLGVTVIDFPMTEIETAELTPAILNVISDLEKYDWIVFTSANGIIHLNKLLLQAGISTCLPSRIRVAVIGERTALQLEKSGRKADYIPVSNTARGLATELKEIVSGKNCKILLPLGNLAPATMETILSEYSEVTRINVYNNLKTGTPNSELLQLIENDQYNIVLFTSPSGVFNFIDTVGREKLDTNLRAASIGSVTTRALEHAGLTSMITAKTSTYEGLADEIINYYKTNK